jgi:divalent metal cation (Fe/Co/Zn/Cd) transporter
MAVESEVTGDRRIAQRGTADLSRRCRDSLRAGCFSRAGHALRPTDAAEGESVVRAVVFEDSAALAGLFLAAIGLLMSEILGTNVPDSLASLLIGLLLAATAFGLARPFADFLVGRSIPESLFEKLHAIVREDAAIEQVLSLGAVYTGPESAVVIAKVHPSASLNVEQLTRAMDDLDHRIRLAVPLIADVFIDVTARRQK